MTYVSALNYYNFNYSPFRLPFLTERSAFFKLYPPVASIMGVVNVESPGDATFKCLVCLKDITHRDL